MKITTRKIVNYSLLVISFLMIVTGYGITKYQFVEKLSLGTLQKSEAFSLHSKFAIIFIVLVLIHVGISWKRFPK